MSLEIIRSSSEKSFKDGPCFGKERVEFQQRIGLHKAKPLQRPLYHINVSHTNVIWKLRNHTGKGKLTLCQYLFQTHLGRFTISYSTCSLSYQEILKELMLPTLVYRRHCTDMLQVYKICHNEYDLDQSEFFKDPVDARTGGHPYKIFKERVTTSARSHFFLQSTC